MNVLKPWNALIRPTGVSPTLAMTFERALDFREVRAEIGSHEIVRGAWRIAKLVQGVPVEERRHRRRVRGVGVVRHATRHRVRHLDTRAGVLAR